MIVKSTWTITILTLISSIGCKMHEEPATTTESSAEYLRKVMTELRDFNLPPELPVRQNFAGSHYNVDDKTYLPGKRHSSGKILIPHSNVQDDLSIQASMTQPVVKKIPSPMINHVIAESGSNNLYYQGHGVAIPSSQKRPAVPFKPEVYRHPMEMGSAVNLNALANALRHRQLPKIINQAESPDTQSMYTYYFYPLKSFVNDVRQGSDLVPAMTFIPENTDMMEGAQKNLSNPLFMAISGFIGMAVLFMIGVLLLPRLGDFRSHVDDDENLLDLTKTVTQAIDQYNCTNKKTYANLDERLRNLCHTVKITKPSSVVLLTKKSALQKEAKRRRKISKKTPRAKKNPERNDPT